jgi:branched-chain amino acid transport system ATP-binding protein
VLKLKNVAVKYGENRALKDISIDVNEGEIVTIVGSNGAGKSTTLKAISGIVKVAAGRIEYEGRALNKLLPNEIVKAGISHCPEGRQLWPDLTVLETLEMGAYIRKDKQGIQKDIDETMDAFPILRERRGQLAGSLSGGEQQALAIARALMSKPKLILFDEPSLGLAPMLVENILATIERLRNMGMTVLLVEQNAYAALQIADRGYVFEKGEVRLTGTAAELLGDSEVKRIYLGI